MVMSQLACALGGLARPFARPPDRPETCENLGETTKITGKRPKTNQIYQNHRKTTKNALARSPVAKSGPVNDQLMKHRYEERLELATMSLILRRSAWLFSAQDDRR